MPAQGDVPLNQPRRPVALGFRLAGLPGPLPGAFLLDIEDSQPQRLATESSFGNWVRVLGGAARPGRAPVLARHRVAQVLGCPNRPLGMSLPDLFADGHVKDAHGQARP
jgi:hypothetical protein